MQGISTLHPPPPSPLVLTSLLLPPTPPRLPSYLSPLPASPPLASYPFIAPLSTVPPHGNSRSPTPCYFQRPLLPCSIHLHPTLSYFFSFLLLLQPQPLCYTNPHHHSNLSQPSPHHHLNHPQLSPHHHLNHSPALPRLKYLTMGWLNIRCITFPR